MKYIISMLVGFTSLLIVGLVYSEISLQQVYAARPDPCFGKHSAGCPNMECVNNIDRLSATCCWTDTQDGQHVCQYCNINTDTGDFENCTDVLSKGKLDSSTLAPPPSGKAPPASTEKCPDNSAVDKNGNCSPSAQLPDDTSDTNKPNIKGNILNDMMSSQSQDSSTSGE